MAKSDEATMKHRGHGSDAFGGTPVGRRVALPRGAREPITVFINGVEQRRGQDYKISDGTIVFREPIYKEQLGDLNWFRKLGLALGVFGWYERNEEVDIQFHTSAGIKLRPHVPVLPEDD